MRQVNANFKLPPRKSTDIGVSTCFSARLATPNADCCELSQRPTLGVGGLRYDSRVFLHCVPIFDCFATPLPKVNLRLCSWHLKPIMEKTMHTKWFRPEKTRMNWQACSIVMKCLTVPSRREKVGFPPRRAVKN